MAEQVWGASSSRVAMDLGLLYWDDIAGGDHYIATASERDSRGLIVNRKGKT
jgi:hypothetical protein